MNDRLSVGDPPSKRVLRSSRLVLHLLVEYFEANSMAVMRFAPAEHNFPGPSNGKHDVDVGSSSQMGHDEKRKRIGVVQR